jgi:hypothetical protein
MGAFGWGTVFPFISRGILELIEEIGSLYAAGQQYYFYISVKICTHKKSTILVLKIEEIKNLLFLRRGGDLNSRGAKRQ